MCVCVSHLELLKGEFRDDCGVTSTVIVVGVVREQRLTQHTHTHNTQHTCAGEEAGVSKTAQLETSTSL